MNTLDNGKSEVSMDTQNNLYLNFNRLDKLEKLILHEAILLYFKFSSNTLFIDSL